MRRWQAHGCCLCQCPRYGWGLHGMLRCSVTARVPVVTLLLRWQEPRLEPGRSTQRPHPLLLPRGRWLLPFALRLLAWVFCQGIQRQTAANTPLLQFCPGSKDEISIKHTLPFPRPFLLGKAQGEFCFQGAMAFSSHFSFWKGPSVFALPCVRLLLLCIAPKHYEF